MKYTVIGDENCIRCGIVCDILEENGIDFEYKYLSEYDDKYALQMVNSAIEDGFTSFPLIFNETINEFVKLEDVV